MAHGGSDRFTRATLTDINWRETFPFSQIFRTFRVTFSPNNPSSICFGIAAVLLCFVGGMILDKIGGQRVVVTKATYNSQMPADEIRMYIASDTRTQFDKWLDDAVKQRDEAIANMLTSFLSEKPSKAAQTVDDDIDDAIDQLTGALKTQRADALKTLDQRLEKSKKIVANEYDKAAATATDEQKASLKTTLNKNRKDLQQAYDFLRTSVYKSSEVAQIIMNLNPSAAVKTLVRADANATSRSEDQSDVSRDQEAILKTIRLADACAQAHATRGQGVFEASLNYGILMFNSAVDSVLNLQWFRNENFKGFTHDRSVPPGLFATLELSAKGLFWLASTHWFFFLVYGLFCLAVWAVAGGAICRLAAVQATRDERIPWNEALKFAMGKWSQFFMAPLIPLVFLLGCCVFQWVMGIVGALPIVGPLLVGLLWILVLVVGVILALVVVGAIGGMGLMYPTIAVEGSDAFDAFSRSYNYVYTRPWRTLFYTIVAAIYGALCFVFVKVFIGLVCLLSWELVGMTMNWPNAGHAAPLGRLEAIWHAPSLSGPFFGQFFLFPLTWTESLGSWFIAMWVFIFVGAVIAFAISFIFTAYTFIYLLLRQHVDATDFEEVYIEEFEAQPPTGDDALEPVATTTTVTTVATAVETATTAAESQSASSSEPIGPVSSPSGEDQPGSPA